MKKILYIIILILIITGVIYFWPKSNTEELQEQEPVVQQEIQQLANQELEDLGGKFCLFQGGEVKMVEGDIDEEILCFLENENTVCEVVSFLKGECGTNPKGKICFDNSGKLVVRGEESTGREIFCVFLDGKECGEFGFNKCVESKGEWQPDLDSIQSSGMD